MKKGLTRRRAGIIAGFVMAAAAFAGAGQPVARGGELVYMYRPNNTDWTNYDAELDVSIADDLEIVLYWPGMDDMSDWIDSGFGGGSGGLGVRLQRQPVERSRAPALYLPDRRHKYAGLSGW